MRGPLRAGSCCPAQCAGHVRQRLFSDLAFLALDHETRRSAARCATRTPGGCESRTQLRVTPRGIALDRSSRVRDVSYRRDQSGIHRLGNRVVHIELHISGHTMFAAAVYPPLLADIAGGGSTRSRRAAIVAGCVVALLVGLSRVVLGTHSVSEIIAGWLLGGLAGFGAMSSEVPAVPRLKGTVLGVTMLWMTLMPATAATVDTHSVVTRIALKLSGHEQPFTRRVLLNRHA